jgi:hypothetical protein
VSLSFIGFPIVSHPVSTLILQRRGEAKTHRARAVAEKEREEISDFKLARRRDEVVILRGDVAVRAERRDDARATRVLLLAIAVGRAERARRALLAARALGADELVVRLRDRFRAGMTSRRGASSVQW